MTDQPRTKAQLEQTFRDFADGEYAAALEEQAEGLGWDPVAAAAAVLARTSQAIATNGQAYYVLPHSQQTAPSASGPVRATGAVLVRREGSAGAELRIPAGKALVARLRGLSANLGEFELTAELVLLPGELGPVSAPVAARRPGDHGNLPPGTLVGLVAEGRRLVACTTTGDGQLWDTGVPDMFSPGDVGRYLQLGAAAPRRVVTYGQIGGQGVVSLEGTAPSAGSYSAQLLEWAELGVRIEQPDALSGGRHGTLDAIGRENGQPRGPGEGDLDYAYRISSLPDVVSPNAIARICALVLSPLGVTFEVHEAQAELLGFILDHTPLDLGGVCQVGGPYPGQALLTLSAERRYFVVCVGTEAATDASGLPFDALNGGINAYDVADQPGDGGPVAYTNALRTLYEALRAAHGFGVGFRIVPTSVYVPWELIDVDLDLTLADGGPEYEQAVVEALEALFQERGRERQMQPWEVVQAVEAGLVRAALNPASVVLNAYSTLSAGARQALQLGALILS